jgi:hypothetical protein
MPQRWYRDAGAIETERNDTMFVRAPLFALIGLAAVSGPAAADDLQIPPRKPGQWEIRMSLGHGLPEMNAVMCLDEKTDAAMMAAGLALAKDVCPEQSVRREGDELVIDSVCAFAGKKTTSHIVITGDMSSAYTVHIQGQVEGMPRKTDMKQEVRWAGPTCDGLKPGEMMMPGGMKIDATRVMRGMGG